MIRRRGFNPSSASVLAGLLLVPGVAVAQSAPSAPAPAESPAQSAAPTAGEPATFVPPSTPSPAPAKRKGGKPGIYEISWDANVEFGFGRAFGDQHNRTVSFGRVRGGVLWVHGDWFTSAGVFYDLANFTPGTFGIQLEQMHLSSGMWIQIGGGVDVEPRPMGMLSVGWSVLGIEAQYRSFGDAGIGPAFFGKLRIPIGVIGAALRNR